MLSGPYVELVGGIAALLLDDLRLRTTHYVTADMLTIKVESTSSPQV